MPTVLVVDDDPDICQLLLTFLGVAGFDVLTACDGQDALHQLACGDAAGRDPAGLDDADHGRGGVSIPPKTRRTPP